MKVISLTFEHTAYKTYFLSIGGSPPSIAAKEKAVAVAGTLGMTLRKPSSIHLHDVDWSYRGRNSEPMLQNAVQNMGGGSGDADSSLAVGQIKITASVNIAFDME